MRFDSFGLERWDENVAIRWMRWRDIERHKWVKYFLYARGEGWGRKNRCRSLSSAMLDVSTIRNRGWRDRLPEAPGNDEVFLVLSSLVSGWIASLLRLSGFGC